MSRAHNFNAGPAVLPEPVLAEASRGVLEIAGSGMSILEISHRSKEFEAILYDARDRMLRVLGLCADAYTVLFLQGGASTQFAMLPMNLLGAGRSADYIDSGHWATRAIKEAARYGGVRVAGSSEAAGYSHIPTALDLDPAARYVHITTNNTIEGTEWPGLPDTGSVPLVADASSDIMAREIDHSRFAMVYAGAQKNAGPAGVTIVVARRDFLALADQDVPTMLAYRTHEKNDSLYNTPPAFGIYVVGLVLKWVEEQGGLAGVEAANRAKAAVVYGALDAYPDVYEPTVTCAADRSLMNLTFRLRDTGRDADFLAGAKDRCMIGLKGHRAVGGFRASMYNACPMESAAALAEYLREFASR